MKTMINRAGKDDYEKKTIDLKELLFFHASEAMDEYLKKKEIAGFFNSTVQRLNEHYITLIDLIKDADLYDEYILWKYGEDNDNVPDWRT